MRFGVCAPISEAARLYKIGFDYVEDKLLNGKVDKAAVMKKNVVGGATC